MSIEVSAVEYSLDAAIGALVEDMPGAKIEEIAERLIEEMPEGAKDSIMRRAMVVFVRDHISKTGRRVLGGEAGKSRFVRAEEVAWEVELLRACVLVNGQPRELGSLTRKECVDAAREREIKAEQTMRRAKQFKALAAILNTRDLATVAEIPVEDLKKIFHV